MACLQHRSKDVVTDRCERFIQAIVSLNDSLKRYEDITQGRIFLSFVGPNDLWSQDELIRVFPDSAIQRFKYSVDIFWKYLKDCL